MSDGAVVKLNATIRGGGYIRHPLFLYRYKLIDGICTDTEIVIQEMADAAHIRRSEPADQHVVPLLEENLVREVEYQRSEFDRIDAD